MTSCRMTTSIYIAARIRVNFNMLKIDSSPDDVMRLTGTQYMTSRRPTNRRRECSHPVAVVISCSDPSESSRDQETQ
jgi:hypothetical protein